MKACVYSWITPIRAAQIIVLLFAFSGSISSQLQIIQPGLFRHLAMWIGNYKIYLPSDPQPALQEFYLDFDCR
jgi:hypothetical protein